MGRCNQRVVDCGLVVTALIVDIKGHYINMKVVLDS